MTKRQKDGLKRLGITPTRYFVEGYPPTWGVALVKDGRDLAVIESNGCHSDDDRLRNKYAVRATRATASLRDDAEYDDDYGNVTLAPEKSIHRTQREAFVAALKEVYHL